jgi:hypothetical protein
MTNAMPTTTPTSMLTWSGTLIGDAEVRIKTDADHATPMLCMQILLNQTLRSYLQVEKPFPKGHFSEAEAAAARLKKGGHVTVQLPAIDLCFTARNVALIELTPKPKNDLFEE